MRRTVSYYRSLALSVGLLAIAACASQEDAGGSQTLGPVLKPQCIGSCTFATTVSLGSGETTPVHRAANSSGQTDFRVTNTSSLSGTAHLSCAGTATTTCTGISLSSVNLGPNESVDIEASWTVGSGPVGLLQVSSDAGGSATQKDLVP